MMRALAIAVLAAAAAAVTQDTDRVLWARAEESFVRNDFAKARIVYEQLAAKFPKSELAPSALLRATYGCDLRLPEEKRAAIELVRRVLRDYPTSDAALHQAEERRHQIDPWTFSTFVSQVRAGSVALDPSRTWGPSSLFVFRRFDPKEFRAAFERGDSDIKTWTTVAERRVEYPFYEQRNRPLTIDLEAGEYGVEETIDGFTNIEHLSVSTYGVLVKALPGRVMVYSVDTVTGEPIANVALEFRWGAKGTATAKTNGDGLAFLAVDDDVRVLADRGGELHRIDLEASTGPKESLCYLTTDRPIYRPGQQVCWKAIRRERDGERITNESRGTVRIEMRDPDGRVLGGSDVAWKTNGAASGSFTLGDEPPLGTYTLMAHVPRAETSFSWWDDEPLPYWKKTFTVAEYRKPEFRVSIDFGGRAAIQGSKATATIQGEYYFGGPVAGGEVAWEVTREYRWSRGEAWPRAPFEDPYAWFYERTSDEEWDDWCGTPGGGSWGGGETVLEGTGRLGADGTLPVSIEIPQARWDARYTLRAEVQDLSRLTASGEATIGAAPSALRVSVGTMRMFYAENDRIAARARVTTPDGKPAANREVALSAFLARDVERPEGNYTNETIEFESFYEGKAKSDASGLVAFEFPAGESGHIRVRARVKDDEGRAAEDRADLWIAGENAKFDDASVLPDKAVYEEGETVKLAVRLPEKGMTGLLVVEGGAFHDAKIIRFKKRTEILELPAKAAYAPNVFIKLALYKGESYYSGGTEIFVFPRSRMLEVSVKADRETYGPREKAKLVITTTSGGKPVASEVELGAVDEAIFAIRKDETKDIRTFFCKLREDDVQYASNCTCGDNWWSIRDRGRSGGAAMTGSTFSLEEGKGGQDGLSEAGFAATETRRWFPDTLKYLAHVATDASGRAEIEIETPDSLTEWRFTARALAGQDQFGWTTSKAVTKKDVICRLIAPRFWTERDEGAVTTVVHNDLAVETEFLVRVTIDGVVQEKKLVVGSHKIGRLDWPVKASKPGEIVVKAEAFSKAVSDAMELTVPVKPHGVESQAVASARIEGAWTASLTLPEGAGDGSVEIVATASSAAAVREALPFLTGYPYG